MPGASSKLRTSVNNAGTIVAKMAGWEQRIDEMRSRSMADLSCVGSTAVCVEAKIGMRDRSASSGGTVRCSTRSSLPEAAIDSMAESERLLHDDLDVAVVLGAVAAGLVLQGQGIVGEQRHDLETLLEREVAVLAAVRV